MILGGDGMFAYDMYYTLKKDKSFQPISLSKSILDITNQKKLKECISTERPYAVINTVGPAVDICEENPAFAKKINVDAVRNCAQWCEMVGARFIHLSTCGLFGDDKKYHTEKDDVDLKTMYAKTKFEGEKAALSSCENTIILRPGWMYGGTTQHKKNFVVNRLRELINIKKVKSAADKFGNPTWTRDAARATMDLIKNEKTRGIFHLSNSEGGSRADYIEAIIYYAKLDIIVERVDSSFFQRKSDVPDCELLNNSYLNSVIDSPMRDWHSALNDYIKNLDLSII